MDSSRRVAVRTAVQRGDARSVARPFAGVAQHVVDAEGVGSLGRDAVGGAIGVARVPGDGVQIFGVERSCAERHGGRRLRFSDVRADAHGTGVSPLFGGREPVVLAGLLLAFFLTIFFLLTVFLLLALDRLLFAGFLLAVRLFVFFLFLAVRSFGLRFLALRFDFFLGCGLG